MRGFTLSAFSLRAIPLLATFWLPGCGDEIQSGVDEPIRVEQAIFRPGRMPGIEPFEGSAAAEGSVEPTGPDVTTVEIAGGIFYRWQQNRRIAGRVSPEGAAIALQIADHGTGYWIRPVDGADALADGEQTFELFASIGDLEPGLHSLRLVAIDEQGVAGQQRDFPICIAAEIPDNLNSCEPTLKPPGAIVSLYWNANADVDLVLIGPDGQVLDARRPFGTSADGGIPADVLRDPTIPRFDRDSNAGCAVDGRRRENIVFPEPPESGTWLIHARLYESCGVPSVNVVAEVYRRLEGADSTWSLLRVAEAGTTFNAVQADGGAGNLTYLFPLTFP
ncbi:MAG: hypothetical protein KGO50_13340 [Myxococcales bacterium]|nr:hypothetical protein [Myxococcales bacterium]